MTPPTAKVSTYIEGEGDPPALEVECPTCKTTGGVWCAAGPPINYGEANDGVHPEYLGRLAYVHVARAEAAEARAKAEAVRKLGELKP